MKKLLIIWLIIISSSIIVWCSSNEVTELKIQNALLQEKLNQAEQGKTKDQEWSLNVKKEKEVENTIKPDKAVITVSWIWWALSTQTSARGEAYYWNESYPINSEESAKDFINYMFTRWWMLLVGCNDWYNMLKCKPFSAADYVQVESDACYLWNEDPNLMRTSVIIECSKI